MKQLPAITRQQAIGTRKDHYLSERQTVLMIPEVIGNLHSLDLIIAQASVELPVRKYKQEDLVKKCSILVKYICKDYGIPIPSQEELQYSATRFLSTLKMHYSDLSLKEVKMAFELASVGELDEWLPKDRHGKPDAKSYGTFNVDYFTKILKAFKSKRNRVWNNVTKLKPKEGQAITKEQRQENKKESINDIYKAFDAFAKDETEPHFVLGFFIEEFLRQGLIKKIEDPTQSTKDKVYRTLLMTKRGVERKKMIADYHAKKLNGVLKNEAKIKEHNIQMMKVFKRLILEKKDIRDVLKF